MDRAHQFAISWKESVPKNIAKRERIMSDTASNHDAQEGQPLAASKRKAMDAGLSTIGRPHKSVKRRASKACQCCRARKVRCNVVEQTPCTNCRLDEVECVVSESKRKKKWSKPGDEEHADPQSISIPRESGSIRSPSSVAGIAQQPSVTFQDSPSHHVPHTLYQDLDSHHFQGNARRQSKARSFSITQEQPEVTNIPSMDSAAFFMAKSQSPMSRGYSLPSFIKPVPLKYGVDDIAYLAKKGALTIPNSPLRNALLQCFINFVHPYMPLLDFHELLHTIECNDENSAVSLLLFQAIMFASTASVDMKYLKAAGYTTRRDARRDFFQKTRLLYDFDYEVDRISLVQSLLLMTYWYETPDDQKDSHHWMGIAVSLSHTIGLHRNPERSNMDLKRQRLWKRIWWSTFMRDRLIALGMRRPTRIKNEDFDVPMLTIEDFDIAVIPSRSLPTGINCKLLQDTKMQLDLATMCIEKAKLCICISHVLSTQYSVLHNNHGLQSNEGNTKSTMMLVARKDDPEGSDVRSCDERLQQWKAAIAPEAEYRESTLSDIASGQESIALHRSLLHMIYFATLSALHRPQVLPSSQWPARKAALEVLDTSRKTVRYAANKITAIAQNLLLMDLVRFLPTSGITVLLPAIIIHLLDIKAPDEATRRASLQGFCQCMQILNKLRDIYAAADYSTAFLEAAIRKAEITLPRTNVDSGRENIRSGMMHAGKGARASVPVQDASRLTPPPDPSAHAPDANAGVAISEDYLARRLNNFLASTPPQSEGHGDGHVAEASGTFDIPDFEPDFDALINLDAAGEAFALDDGAFPMMQEGGGFSMDMDWMKGMTDDTTALI